MLTVTEVWQQLDSLAAPLPSEAVPLAAALGRILREDVVAPEDQPPFDRSAIDGWVVPLSASADTTVRVAGTISVGTPAPRPPAPGEAIKLFTGSAVPLGEVGLVMREDALVAASDPTALILRAAPSRALIRKRGSQCVAGARLLSAGNGVSAGALALLASIGHARPVVARHPRVAHLVTGGELVPPESCPTPGQIRDSNSALVAALLSAAGAQLIAHARAAESYTSAAAGFSELLATEPDLVLVSGGSSGGDHDHTARLFQAHGFSLVVNQVASRPGKPLLVARRGAQIAVGLPGNPVSHFVCFHLFVARILARFGGAVPAPLLRLPLAAGAPLRCNPRETWWPATRLPSGYSPLPWADSSDLTTLALTHALLRVPSDAAPDSCAYGILV